MARSEEGNASRGEMRKPYPEGGVASPGQVELIVAALQTQDTGNYEGIVMRPKSRYLFVLAVGCLMALPASLPLARSAGRDFSRCIHTCNVARTNCEDRCVTDCAVLYPNNAAQRKACASTCHNICVGQEQDCKDICKAIKKDESPQEP